MVAGRPSIMKGIPDNYLPWDIMGISNLVGGIPTPLKNMKVSWDDYSQYMEK